MVWLDNLRSIIIYRLNNQMNHYIWTIFQQLILDLERFGHAHDFAAKVIQPTYNGKRAGTTSLRELASCIL